MSSKPPIQVTGKSIPQEPSLCAVVARTRHGVMIDEMHGASSQGAGMVELRLDFLSKAPDFKRLFEKKPCSALITVRRKNEGGKFTGTEAERLTILRQAIVSGADWVDLEQDVVEQVQRYGKVKRIVSYHNFSETPADIFGIYEKLCSFDADVVKIACMAKTPDDIWRVMELYQNAPKPTVAFCMGEMGFPTRILSAKFGAPFIYSTFNPDRTIAPGIPFLKQLRNLYCTPKINAETTVYGVVGDPIGHSLSPLIHNAGFRQLGINAVYVPFMIPERYFTEFLKGAHKFGVNGLSVTIPHKESAAYAAKACDLVVRSTSSANTLLNRPLGWEGFNTDYQGVVDALVGGLPPLPSGEPAELKARQVLILGAGGVARSIGFALLQQGAIVTISNRTTERAQRLAMVLNCRHQDWVSRHNVLADIVINATSLGMYPDENATPIHGSFFRPGMVVFDTVYNPENTLFLKEARERGSVVVTGLELFIRQGAAQFQHFTGMAPPAELMRQVARQALTRVITKVPTV